MVSTEPDGEVGPGCRPAQLHLLLWDSRTSARRTYTPAAVSAFLILPGIPFLLSCAWTKEASSCEREGWPRRAQQAFSHPLQLRYLQDAILLPVWMLWASLGVPLAPLAAASSPSPDPKWFPSKRGQIFLMHHTTLLQSLHWHPHSVGSDTKGPGWQ